MGMHIKNVRLSEKLLAKVTMSDTCLYMFELRIKRKKSKAWVGAQDHDRPSVKLLVKIFRNIGHDSSSNV